MKKKLLSALGVSSLALLAGCGGGANDSNSLHIASFTNEALIWATAFQAQHPDLDLTFTEITMEGGHYQEWLMPLLATGGNVPDVIFLEAEFIRQFVESPFLRDLTHLVPYAHAIDTFQFTLDAGNHNGIQYAFSPQATPGVMYFRRSMAIEYFGTDDPAYIQTRFSSLEQTLDSARIIRDASGGSSFFVSGANSFFRGFGSNRQQPWIIDNVLTIDPLMLEFIDFARILRNENLEARIGQWTPDWFQGMDDNLVSAGGQPMSVFAYLLPTWGLTHVLGNNTETTAGDWGVIQGPLPYQWGGTWMAVTRDAANQDLAEEFIRFATLNADSQRRFATGEFTNEYLRSINPDIPSGLSQAPGDFVSSRQVVNDISSWFDGTEAYHFLGGQNPYEIFGELAPNVTLRLMQGTDAYIGDRWQDAVGSYLDGELGSVADLIQSFRNSISIGIPDVDLSAVDALIASLR